MANNEYLALDVGVSRTGFARGSDLAKIAEPLFTVPTDQALNKALGMINDSQIAGLVVGLPRNLDGEDTQQTTWVRDWVAEAKPKIKIPIYIQDEALTTKLAEAKKIEQDLKHDVDALAASIILQDFLDSPESERTIW